MANNETTPLREKYGALLLSGEKEEAFKLVETHLLQSLIRIYYSVDVASEMLEEMNAAINGAKRYIERTDKSLPEYHSSAENFIKHFNEVYKVNDTDQ